METKTTRELEKLLNDPHGDPARFLTENAQDFLPKKAFSTYVRNFLSGAGMTQQELFLRADISEGYGYKLLSEEKRTRQRDVILRLCYAAGMSLAQTQKALTLYGMPTLYARNPRDAVLMIAFNQRPGDIIEVNEFLLKNGQDMLRNSGSQN